METWGPARSKGGIMRARLVALLSIGSVLVLSLAVSGSSLAASPARGIPGAGTGDSWTAYLFNTRHA